MKSTTQARLAQCASAEAYDDNPSNAFLDREIAHATVKEMQIRARHMGEDSEKFMDLLPKWTVPMYRRCIERGIEGTGPKIHIYLGKDADGKRVWRPATMADVVNGVVPPGCRPKCAGRYDRVLETIEEHITWLKEDRERQTSKYAFAKEPELPRSKWLGTHKSYVTPSPSPQKIGVAIEFGAYVTIIGMLAYTIAHWWGWF